MCRKTDKDKNKQVRKKGLSRDDLLMWLPLHDEFETTQKHLQSDNWTVSTDWGSSHSSNTDVTLPTVINA